MATTIDYYFAPQSPWTYLGHLRFWDIARRQGAAIRVLPVDLPGKVFPSSGGLPLAKRAPQRQAYRLVELKRWSDYLHAPLNLEPNYYPVDGDQVVSLWLPLDPVARETSVEYVKGSHRWGRWSKWAASARSSPTPSA